MGGWLNARCPSKQTAIMHAGYSLAGCLLVHTCCLLVQPSRECYCAGELRAAAYVLGMLLGGWYMYSMLGCAFLPYSQLGFS
jgi:hypothetical protein